MGRGSAAKTGIGRGPAAVGGARKVGENKLLSQSGRYNPLGSQCKLCKQRVTQERATYCQGACSKTDDWLCLQKGAVCYLWQADPRHVALQAVLVRRARRASAQRAAALAFVAARVRITCCSPPDQAIRHMRAAAGDSFALSRYVVGG
mgnify:FL=1